VLRVRGLAKRFRDFPAVDGLSFTVAAGEVMGLVGPNGAGKTTTLRRVTGIIPYSAGRVEIVGHDLAEDPVEAKRQVAFVPDDPQFFEHLTVEEHLTFTARLYNVENADIRGPELLAALELTDKSGSLPSQLSRGMRQKLAIACALLHRPRVLLYDEPLTGLDPAGMRRMKATLRREAEAGTAVVLSSHLLHLVEEFASTVLVMARGRAVAAGPIEEIVRDRPQLEGLSLEEAFLALTGQEREDERVDGEAPC